MKRSGVPPGTALQGRAAQGRRQVLSGRTAAWYLRPERHSCLLAAVAGYPVRVSLPQGCSGGADLSGAAAGSGLAVHDLAGLSRAAGLARAVAWLAEQPGSGVSPDVTMEALQDVMSFF
ncbi:hypothetical protein LHK_03245 [Laribacter hongkongensis HLHK9]|uniref:Uncharacterized protein n=1 Tax=Laribacter hongkongensis (strain HLHK9) TaxID=557598 RepID=C1D6X2_LARHH|nr:hypothetical protein LHK_03245 [Laribacter hongkongensis HLHK9]